MPRSFTVAALVLGLGAAAAAPASAANRQFDLWTGTSYTPGRAHTYGVVEFNMPWAVTVRGRLNDVCNGNNPGDGHGAYLKVTFVLDNGATRERGPVADQTGCRNADGVDVSITQHVARDRTIRAVRLHLYEYDADRNSTADTADKRIRRP
jgi:hypothetical protein